MELKDLMLKKEEIPILHENCFQVPIHPKLLNPNIKIDENLARKVFPKVAHEWYEELKEYSNKLEDKDTKNWIDRVFLKKKPRIKKEYSYQVLDTLLHWEDRVFTSENGFANLLSISRDAGGSLYFQKDNFDCRRFCSFDSPTEYIRFSKDKSLEFNIEDKIITGKGFEGIYLHVYASHNIDYYPGALFLRNWAINYLNEAMKEISD